jgi:hypothetical protein
MQTVNEILKFHFSHTTFQQAAKTCIPANIIRLHEIRINRLNTVTEEIGNFSFKFTGSTIIPQVFNKFKTIIKTGVLPLKYFDIRELRTLSYALSHSEQNKSEIFSNPRELDLAFQVLESNWKDSYLIGLIECYLKNWETSITLSSEKLGTFIFNKINGYEGSRGILTKLKNNIKYFDIKNGDLILGSELVLKKIQIRAATKYLSLPDSWFVYPYFSKVILAYYVKRQNVIQYFIDDLSYALQEHNSSVSNKRLVSKLIIQANNNEFAALQDKVKTIAFKFIGDPGKASLWSPFLDATESEKGELKQARKILNEWITREFLNVFFEKCINDPRRKLFWLKYAREITQFRVVGSASIRRMLISDKRISEYVPQRFSTINSTSDKNSALMFLMKEHLFIEFSDAGAFYAYKLSNPNAPSIDRLHFSSSSSLKTPSMSWLIYRTGNTINQINEEGRLGHNDGELGWEDIADYWLKNKADINV